MRDHYLVDAGASNVENLIVPYNTTSHLQGVYRIPALAIECTVVLTNKAPLSAYRGAGRPEAIFAMDRIVDRAARQLGIDPVELRRRNMVTADEMPYDAGILYRDGKPLVVDGGDFHAALDGALDRAGYVDVPGGAGGGPSSGPLPGDRDRDVHRGDRRGPVRDRPRPPHRRRRGDRDHGAPVAGPGPRDGAGPAGIRRARASRWTGSESSPATR